MIGSFTDLPGSAALSSIPTHAEKLAHLGTSCPDHFIRTKDPAALCDWDQPGMGAVLRGCASRSIRRSNNIARNTRAIIRSMPSQDRFAGYARCQSTVVLVPGVGMFSFGKNKTEARITGEFYVNAIHVMEGAGLLGDGPTPPIRCRSQARRRDRARSWSIPITWRLPPSEAFRIEYWALEEAKIRRQPAGEGVEPPLAMWSAAAVASAAKWRFWPRNVERTWWSPTVMLTLRKALREAEASCRKRRRNRSHRGHPQPRAAIRDSAYASDRGLWRTRYSDQYGGAVSVFTGRHISDEQWGFTLDLNVTANYLLAEEAA